MHYRLSLLLSPQLFQLTQSVELSVLTQNIKFIPIAGGSIDMMNERAKEYGDLLVGLGDKIPDVIGFQEMFVEEPTTITLAKIAVTHPYQLHSFPETLPDGAAINSGLALASRFPIEAYDFRMFTEASGYDKLAAKGVLVALIRLPASFAVISITHQQAGISASIANSQLGTGKSLMENFVRSNIPASALHYTAAISMGDFNIEFGDGTNLYQQMIDTLAYEVEDPHTTLNPGQDGFTSPPSNPIKRIDYVLNLKSIDESGMCAFPSSVVINHVVNFLILQGTLKDIDELSDHLGVEATFFIDENPDGALPNLINDNDSCNSFAIPTGSPTTLPTAVSATSRTNVESSILCLLFVIHLLAL